MSRAEVEMNWYLGKRKIAVILNLLLLLISTKYSYAKVNIAITKTSESYVITANFVVKSTTDVVWTVLTDYDNISSFVSSISLSRVKERKKDSLYIEQSGANKILPFFSIKVHLLLKVVEDRFNGKIYFEDMLNKDFKSYNGVWELQNNSSETLVTYYLKLQPKMFLPDFIAEKYFLSRAEIMCNDIILDINKRFGLQ